MAVGPKLILTRDARGVIAHVELEGVEVNDAGRIEIPFVDCVQITDRPYQFPIVGIQLRTHPDFELVQQRAEAK